MADPKIFTLADLKQHAKRDDCFLAIHGKVYDVTKFLDEHPGGGEVVLDATGRDSTQDFEDVGHSQEARKMLDKYYVGEYQPADDKKPAAAKPSVPAAEPEKGGSGLLTYLLIPIAIAVVAFVYRHW
mmetsp:Transcript_11789/g.20498  ORF Transcript_11789/g.20498 Transcript_11789/m.20498 type:complete len:127 (+) Transcript_11789:79-459(+)